MTQVTSLAEWNSLHAKAGNKAVCVFSSFPDYQRRTTPTGKYFLSQAFPIPWTTLETVIGDNKDAHLYCVPIS